MTFSLNSNLNTPFLIYLFVCVVINKKKYHTSIQQQAVDSCHWTTCICGVYRILCCYCVPCGSTKGWYSYDPIPAIPTKGNHIWKNLCQLHNAVMSTALVAFYDLDFPQYRIPPMPDSMIFIYFWERENYTHYTAYDPFMYIYFSFSL